MRTVDFYDYPRHCDTTYIFKTISEDAIARLAMDREPERRIPFRPVTTHPALPVGTAFVGLNSYCGNDYREAFSVKNFAVWAIDRYQPKLFSVMELYRDNLHRLQGRSIYFTNLMKVVPPWPQFAEASAVQQLLESSRELTSLFHSLLQAEIQGLALAGCKVIVCFGDLTWNHVGQALGSSVAFRETSECENIRTWKHKEKSLLLVKQRHFSRYRKDETIHTISMINAAKPSS